MASARKEWVLGVGDLGARGVSSDSDQGLGEGFLKEELLSKLRFEGCRVRLSL